MSFRAHVLIIAVCRHVDKCHVTETQKQLEFMQHLAQNHAFNDRDE